MNSAVKFFFYFHHLIKMATVNKVRLILTSIGIFVAVFLFCSGKIITDSYYSESMRKVSQMSENTVIVNPMGNKELKQELAVSDKINCIDVSTLSEKQSIFSVSIGDNRYLTVMAYVHGISELNSVMPIVTDDGCFISVESNLIKGRLISNNDIQTKNAVVVIDRLTESLIFSGGNGLGKYIEIGCGAFGATVSSQSQANAPVRFEVIGVVENSYTADVAKMKLKHEIDSSQQSITTCVSIYCPLTSINERFARQDKNSLYLYNFNNHGEYNNFLYYAQTLSEVKSRTGNGFSVITKDNLSAELENELSNTKTILNMISVLLCVISGISIMSITFFSVKERIPEIGIRKAFGAGKLDIAFQFVFEMIIIAVFASLLAIGLSIVTCKLLETFLIEILYMTFSVNITPQMIIAPLLVGIFEAVVCCIVPSLYAAEIKVTDSLRFE